MSKVLKISKHKLDLAKLELSSPSMIIGRSPLCDQILRAPGIRPVQFLLEWIGEGEFNPNEGMWTIFDMGHLFSDDSLSLSDLSGEGVLLTTDQKMKGLNFEIVEDRIMASNIQKGIITEHIKESASSNRPVPKTKLAIEVVILDKEDQKVLNIFHFFDRKFSTHQYNSSLPFAVVWKKGDLAKINFANKPKAIFDLKGQRVNHSNEVDITINDSFIMHFEHDIYFVRFVNRVKYEVISESLFKNKFVLGSIVMFAAFFALVLGLGTTHNENIELEQHRPERVVKIVEYTPPPIENKIIEEVKPIEKNEVVEEPKEEIKEELPPVEKIEPPKLVDMEKVEKPKKMERPKPALKSSQKPKVIEKVTDVNSVGLLSKIKPSKVNVNKQISEESITKTLNTEKSMTNNEKSVLIQTSQTGLVSQIKSNSKGGGVISNNPNALEGVETQLKGAKEFTSQDSSPIVKTSGMSENAAIGSSLGKASKGSLKGSASLSGDGGEISGGLTKNQVAEVINSHRREIRTCYESALLIRNDLNGIMRLSFGINIAGNVTEVKVVNTEMNSNILESCIVQVIKSMKFPEASNQSPTTVIYPFVFKRSS